MTQEQEKARELVDKFAEIIPIEDAEHGETESYFIQYEKAKQCALIAVDEIIGYSRMHGFIGLTEYWHEVKNEIEKL